MKRVYVTQDKSTWGEGPWQDEADKVSWTDEATGLPCLAVRNHYGAWCGYAGVSPGHPLYGKGYDEVDIYVHGGLTYANSCAEGPEATSICHIPEPGEPEHVWWFGFDCNHGYDYAPALRSKYGLEIPELFDPEHTTYKPFSYVEMECTNLAAQLKGEQ